MGSSWGSSWFFWVQVGGLGSHFGAKLGLFGAFLAPSGRSWGPFCLQVGSLRLFLCEVGPHGSKLGPVWGQVGAKLGQVGAKLGQVGAKLGQVGAMLGEVGPKLGPMPGHFGLMLEVLGVILAPSC